MEDNLKSTSTMEIDEKHFTIGKNHIEHLINLTKEQYSSLNETRKNIKNLNLQEKQMNTELNNLDDKLEEIENQIELFKQNIEEIMQQNEFLSSTSNNTYVDTNKFKLMKNYFNIEIEFNLFDQENLEIKFIFDHNKYATVHYNIIDKRFYLQQLEPLHKNFINIKTFLYNTSDISGFLYSTRNHLLNGNQH